MNIVRLSMWAGCLIVFFEMSLYSVVHAEVSPNDPHINAILPGGRVTLFAGVVNGGCIVDVSNSDRFVRMGEVKSNQFAGVGSDAQAVPFSIQLDECSSNIIESVAVGFTGVMNEQDLQVLALTPEPNGAQGIGLALFRADNTLLPINTMPVDFMPLNKGVNTLNFLAKYRLTQQHVTPGVANAWANFTLLYQ